MNFSIITINYNNASGLADTVKSVISQTFQDFEYIVIDGGSSDGSVDIINKYKDYISYWVSEADKGVYDAMNKGISYASGDYLMFLNSGDCLAEKDTIANCVELIEKNEGKDIYYGDLLTLNHKDLPDKTYWKYSSEINLFYFKHSTINHQAALIKASLFQEFGLYPTNYRLASDYWLWIISCIHNKEYCHLSLPIVFYDFSGISAKDNYKLYVEEREAIWRSLVPPYVQKVITKAEGLNNENQRYRQLTEYRIIKRAISLNDFFQKLKTT